MSSSTEKSCKCFRYIVWLKKRGCAGQGGFPIGGQTNVNIANNHLQYAFTWYSLAITLIVIYFVFHWRRGSKEEAP